MQNYTLRLDKIVGGGQAMGTLEDGKKAFVWGGLPGEMVTIALTKKKKSFVEGVVQEVVVASPERVTPADSESYLSTSPWQIMEFEAEQRHKSALIDEAFALHTISLPEKTIVYSDGITRHYRNKVEFSWYGNEDENGNETLDLAFFRRGSKGKIPIDQCSLLPKPMMQLALAIRDILHSNNISARQLKTLLIRSNKNQECVWQLYTKVEAVCISDNEASKLPALGGEIIYSDPKSPASKITKRIASYGNIVLEDELLGVPFRYATEGFFQINLPVYEQSLRDMMQYIPDSAPVVDMYSGVGTIGLTIGGKECTLVEIDANAVREMNENILRLKSSARAILAPSEKALDHISSESTIIVDPPRAGLHKDVIERLLETLPQRVVYLSCNPATQARDVALLLEKYSITHHRGYNFFPRTPHIEHLVVLDV